MIYLDYAAKAPELSLTIDDEIQAHNCLLNPNQPYAYGEKKLLKEAEQTVLKALKSYTGHVVFGANATMLFEWLGNRLGVGVDPFAMSAYEHDCVDRFGQTDNTTNGGIPSPPFCLPCRQKCACRKTNAGGDGISKREFMDSLIMKRIRWTTHFIAGYTSI